MRNDYFVFPSDVDAKAEALKAKFGHVVDRLSKIVKEKIKGR
ncbi:hypothetical protein A2U01_0073900, partial [Trifolium medium]|nr:hypothetical protein [Trifolium medium]